MKAKQEIEEKRH